MIKSWSSKQEEQINIWNDKWRNKTIKETTAADRQVQNKLR